MEKALYFDKEVEVITRGIMFSQIQNVGDPSSARTASTANLKPLRYQVMRGHGSWVTKTRRQLTISPANFVRLCEIWRRDPNFSMPISISPAQEKDVVDEIPSADEGITIASERKLAPSYDVVFSANLEVYALLEESGGHAGPYFDSPDLRVFNGPRKAMYNALLDAGFVPTRMAVEV